MVFFDMICVVDKVLVDIIPMKNQLRNDCTFMLKFVNKICVKKSR
jgi:hypothetical protein